MGTRGNHPLVLGVSASHNGAACILRRGEIVAAIQEERLIRAKRARIWGALPSLAIEYCLRAAGAEPRDLDLVAFSCQSPMSDPWHAIENNPQLFSGGREPPILRVSHHLAHAASALALSGAKQAAILIVDGMGSPVEDIETPWKVGDRNEDACEWASIYFARGSEIFALRKHLVVGGEWLTHRSGGMPYFGSLGGMYSAASQQIFGDATQAGKVMGLAAYGSARVPVEEFFDFDGGSFKFRREVSDRHDFIGPWPSHSDEHQDLAASTQRAFEVGLGHLLAQLKQDLPEPVSTLCYAGGVALNSTANERIVLRSGFENYYIPSAAEDNGPAIGAAFAGLWSLIGEEAPTRIRRLRDDFGRSYSEKAIETALASTNAVRGQRADDVGTEVARRLLDGQIVGWLQGGSEFGPRSLGRRTILCDPRGPGMKDHLNGTVKFREPFRPFAPSVLAEHASSWFEGDFPTGLDPFMLRAAPIRREVAHEVPAVVHVDGTCRLQTVPADPPTRFRQLLERFFDATGVPMILNTSFNVAGEPIIESPLDAIRALVWTKIDCCVIEDWIIERVPPFDRLELEVRPVTTAGAIHVPIGLGDPNREVVASGNLLAVMSGMGTADLEMKWRSHRIDGRAVHYAEALVDSEFGALRQLLDLPTFRILVGLSNEQRPVRLGDWPGEPHENIKIAADLHRRGLVSVHLPMMEAAHD